MPTSDDKGVSTKNTSKLPNVRSNCRNRSSDFQHWNPPRPLRIFKNSQHRSTKSLSTSSGSDSSRGRSECSRVKKVPRAESESQILDLLKELDYPMTQINGQRKLGPPPTWVMPPPDPKCEVFVGNIPRDLYENAIYPIFNRVGQIYEIRLMMDFAGTNRGYCFVMYTTYEDAQRAIKELDNYEIRNGRRIGVVASVNNCRLRVDKLPYFIDSKMVITKFFNVTDNVKSVAVYKNNIKEFCYVIISYNTHRSAAIGRRRLMPECANLFDNIDISIDWAHPNTVPYKVVEELATMNENGILEIRTSVIGLYEKPTRSGRSTAKKSNHSSVNNNTLVAASGNLQNSGATCNCNFVVKAPGANRPLPSWGFPSRDDAASEKEDIAEGSENREHYENIKTNAMNVQFNNLLSYNLLREYAFRVEMEVRKILLANSNNPEFLVWDMGAPHNNDRGYKQELNYNYTSSFNDHEGRLQNVYSTRNTLKPILSRMCVRSDADTY